MSTDPFTEMLWNHLCLPRQVDAGYGIPFSVLTHKHGQNGALSLYNDASAAVPTGPDVGTVPDTASTKASSTLIDPVTPDHGSGALAYLREVNAFINTMQHTTDGLTSGYAGGGAHTFATPGGLTAAPSDGDPISPSAINAVPEEAGPTGYNASDFFWIGNTSAAEALAQACNIDPNLASVMQAARSALDVVTPGHGELSAIIDHATVQMNWNAQFNVMMDNDRITQSVSMTTAGDGAWQTTSQDITSGANAAANNAQIGEVDTGYDLIVVTGNYYEYNIVLQVNIVFDSDTIRQLLSGGLGGGSYEGDVSAGGNTTTNEAGITHVGLGGPLLLGGDFYQTNDLIQYSFLSDADIAKAAAAMLGLEGADAYELMQSILAGGNSQGNNLSVLEIGTAANIWSLNDLSALKLAFFTGHGSLGELLTLGNGEVGSDTLFVDGDYAEVNVLIQFNVIFDSDTIDQDALAGGPGSAGQAVSAGANGGSNSAYILDSGTSAVLVVAGDYYESNTVVQANFIHDNDTIFQDVDQTPQTQLAMSADPDEVHVPVLSDALYAMSA